MAINVLSFLNLFSEIWCFFRRSRTEEFFIFW